MSAGLSERQRGAYATVMTKGASHLSEDDLLDLFEANCRHPSRDERASLAMTAKLRNEIRLRMAAGREGASS